MIQDNSVTLHFAQVIKC